MMLVAQEIVVMKVRAVFPDLIALYLFGSQAQGRATAQSDVDLAVLVEGYADPLERWNLSNDLADVVQCPVDLIDLRAASTVMQYQVVQYGQRLWAITSKADLFDCFVSSEKLALDAARSGLLVEIAQRGKIYD